MAITQNGGAGQPPMLHAAWGFAKRGIRVFPCWPGEKTPATEHGFKDASSGLAVIEQWWLRNPDANIGIATGRISGIWISDIDADKHTGEPVGEISLRALEAQHGALPETVQVITPRRGRHLYWRWPSGREIRSSASQVAAGIDIRADGGYALAPPSVALGRRYEWSIDSATSIADAPAWLVDLACAPRGRPGERLAPPAEALAALIHNDVSEGARNVTLTRLVGHLLRRDVDAAIALDLVDAFNAARCKPPLPSEVVLRICNSIAKAEWKRRTGQ
jgi:hypothetical protein